MLAVCEKKPFMPHRPDKAISNELEWWLDTISTGAASRPILPPPTYHDLDAFSDASTGVGIGIIIRQRWRAWRLLPDWQTRDSKRDIAWAEAVGFELLLETISSTFPQHPHVIVYCDNTSVVESWRIGRHRNNAVNGVFKRIHALLAHSSSPITGVIAKFIPTEHNPADSPSRGTYGPRHLVLPPIPIPQHLQQFIIDFEHPPTPSELRALADGQYAPTAAKLVDRLKREQEVNKRTDAIRAKDDHLILHSLTRQ